MAVQIRDWNINPDLNIDPPPAGFREFLKPSELNDGVRNIMSAKARRLMNQTGILVSSTVGDVDFKITTETEETEPIREIYYFEAHKTSVQTNPEAEIYFQVNTAERKPLRGRAEVLKANEILIGRIYAVVYNGTYYQLLNGEELETGG